MLACTGDNAVIKRSLLASFLLYGLLLLCVLLLLFALLLDAPNASGWRWVYAVWNFGHVVLFAVVTHTALRWRQARTDLADPGVHCGVKLVLGMAALGALIEVAQWLIGRDCEWQDIVADTLGAAVVVLFSREWRQALPLRWQRIASVMAGGLLLAWALQDVVLHSVDTVQRRMCFPELYSPASLTATAARLELLRIKVARVTDATLSSQPLLQVNLLPGEFSTFTLDQLYADWQGYDTLVWRWYNPGAPLAFTCRAHDLQHERNGFDHRDRFNQPLVLATGWNTLTFSLASLREAPVSREMNLTHMRSIACFASHLEQSHTLYLEGIFLARSKPPL